MVTRWCRPFLEPLAEALHVFSLDLVKIVCGYLVWPTATAGATPKLLLTIGSQGFGDGLFPTGRSCYGIACSHVDNTIWVSSYRRVQVFDCEGKFLYQAAEGQWRDPMGIAFAANDEAFIADNEARCIVVCRPDGSLARRMGSEGKGEGQFNRPHDVALDRKRELLLVGDNYGHRVQVLGLDGSFVRAWMVDDEAEDPRGIALSEASGEIALCNWEKVKVFDNTGALLRHFGKRGKTRGELHSPCKIAADSAGNWLVSDIGTDRVSVFAADGSFITAFGEKGEGPGQFASPGCVCVDNDGRVLVGDTAYRVQVFGFCNSEAAAATTCS